MRDNKRDGERQKRTVVSSTDPEARGICKPQIKTEIFAFHSQKYNFSRAFWAEIPNCTPKTTFKALSPETH